MAGKKKQHFVPQFYMRNFAIDPDRRHISLYVIKSRKYIPSAPIKDQAYKHNFYGQTGTEDKLSELESEVAPIIKTVISDSILPSRKSDDYIWLLAFALFQDARTPAAACRIDKSNEEFVRKLALEYPDLRHFADGIQVKDPDTPSLALHITSEILPFAEDLCCKLLINKTRRAFIASDSPTVRYNQFLEKRHLLGSNTGIACKGLQIFLPLGPRHLVMFFDGSVYRVGGRKHLERLIEVVREDDVKTLNMMQAANADGVLYFSPDTDPAQVREVADAAQQHRRDQRVGLAEHPAVGPRGQIGTVVHTFQVDLRMNAALDFCVVLPTAAGPPLPNRAVHLRDPAAVGRFEADRLSGGPYDPRKLVEEYIDKQHPKP
jgi:hypothetical protein